MISENSRLSDWRAIPHPRHRGRLLLKFDPKRDLIEIQERGEKYVVDLSAYRAAPGDDAKSDTR